MIVKPSKTKKETAATSANDQVEASVHPRDMDGPTQANGQKTRSEKQEVKLTLTQSHNQTCQKG